MAELPGVLEGVAGAIESVGAGFAAVAAPVAIVGGAIAASVAILVSAKDATINIGNETVRVGDLIKGIWLLIQQSIGQTIDNIVKAAKSFFDHLKVKAAETFGVIGQWPTRQPIS